MHFFSAECQNGESFNLFFSLIKQHQRSDPRFRSHCWQLAQAKENTIGPKIATKTGKQLLLYLFSVCIVNHFKTEYCTVNMDRTYLFLWLFPCLSVGLSFSTFVSILCLSLCLYNLSVCLPVSLCLCLCLCLCLLLYKRWQLEKKSTKIRIWGKTDFCRVLVENVQNRETLRFIRFFIVVKHQESSVNLLS